jgi:hypothetical protein
LVSVTVLVIVVAEAELLDEALVLLLLLAALLVPLPLSVEDVDAIGVPGVLPMELMDIFRAPVRGPAFKPALRITLKYRLNVSRYGVKQTAYRRQ